MKCGSCGGKMVKWKYLQYEELQSCLFSKNRLSDNIGKYSEWLRTLKADELVMVSFKREDYNKPILCGIYHWRKVGIRNLIFLYRTREFEGELSSSKEGEVYWLSEDEFISKNLAPGMEQVWKIMHTADIGECYMHLEGTEYVETLL